MKSVAIFYAVTALLAGDYAMGFVVRPTAPSFVANIPSTTQRNMFGGTGATPEADPEKEAQIEAAAKSMGFTVKEYKLVLKMQENLANAVNSLRVTGGSVVKGVTVELDGNSPAIHIKISITDAGKALGKAMLEKELVSALKEATDAAKKGQQTAIQKMNQDIAEELKGSP